MAIEKAKLSEGQRWLEELLRLAALPTTVIVDEAGADNLDGSFWLTLDSSGLTAAQVEILIGSNGDVIDSIQYLINTTLNLNLAEDQRRAYTVELGEYRVRRQAELQAMADQAIDHVRRTGEDYEIKDLSSAERRQVHTFLKEYEDLETYSRGQEPDRRLVVKRASRSDT